MFYSLVILEMLWFAACSQAACSNVTVCIAGGSDSDGECLKHNVAHIHHSLMDITPEARRCRSVRIYLTKGTHFLTEDLDFADSVEETEIHGQLSTIVCLNNTGIRFSESVTANSVLISDLSLLHCRRSYENSIAAALYFKYASYNLFNMTIQNTEGHGLYADHCIHQVVFNTTFNNNSNGSIKIALQDNLFPVTNVSVEIRRVKQENVRWAGVGIYLSISVNCNLSIIDCEMHGGESLRIFARNYSASMKVTIRNSTFDSRVNVLFKGAGSMMVYIHDSVFRNSTGTGLLISNAGYVEIARSRFCKNNNGIILTSVPKLVLQKCFIHSNKNFGLSITQLFIYRGMPSQILKTDFFNNSRALSFKFRNSQNQQFKISECAFRNQRLFQTLKYNAAAVMIQGPSKNSSITMENSHFIGNHGFGESSVLLVQDFNNLTLSNVNITDNTCTGIKVSRGSEIKLANTVRFIRNHGLNGGAISIEESATLMLMASSRVLVINNTARVYGGGIYSDMVCIERFEQKCFFQFDKGSAPPISEAFFFSGNSAERGGDMIFGGCLQRCYIDLNGSIERICINQSDHTNIFWDLVSVENARSSSTFATDPKQVVFCANTNSSSSGITCANSFTVNAYRGQVFSVPLMVRGDLCYPSMEVIEADIINHENSPTLQLVGEKLRKGGKQCSNYSFALQGGTELKTASMSFRFAQQPLLASGPVLTVNLSDCPAGYQLNSNGVCDCHRILKKFTIECNPHSYSLKIPARTWVGELASGQIAVQRNCQYCSRAVENISGLDSNRLCSNNRRNVMCGACIEGHSLLLGGYECADCSNSTYKGVLLLIAFVVAGLALVLLMLCLNLTVSTGMINGLIFYSNIVYLNSDTLLPITRKDNDGTHLENTVQILSTFQAWMNLDFGIATCFFDGYNTYTSSWIQFLFPLYIWLLILVIVLASRYSSRISKMTTSNTVSVLATLLLLSYAKLLKICIGVASFTNVQLIHDSSKYYVWMLDGNISHLHGKHVPLFLMGLFMVLVYIIPFTLLILLGPLLQATSNYRVLRWINKLKPFLDAFYGPYTTRYRYWPGILLLSRLIVFFIYAYFGGNHPLKQITVCIVVTVLLVSWMLIGKTRKTSLHQSRLLNCLELFFFLNLEIFTIASIYHSHISENATKQQGLAVAMVGSVLVVFCGIVAYQVFSCVSRNHKATRKFVERLSKGKDKPSSPLKKADVSTKTTCSIVEMTDDPLPTNELREPLLASS